MQHEAIQLMEYFTDSYGERGSKPRLELSPD